MRRFLILLMYALWSLLLLLFFYPLLHESGHALAAALLGERIMGFQIFPVPSVDIALASVQHQAVISISGLLLPLLVGALLSGVRGLARLANMELQLFSLVSLVVELAAAVQYYYGDPLPGDDITRFIEYSGWPVWGVCLFLGILALLSGAILVSGGADKGC